MKILLYNPDNGVTRNFMPHLWMFLLQALTPAGHEVLLIDGNAQPMDESEIARFVREQNIGLVGIGAMTRMIAKAYRMADAIRAAGAPLLRRAGGGWGTFRMIPVESGRGCPYGCEFCAVTGFFGDSIRFRANEGFVVIGASHQTPEFACAAIRLWWLKVGRLKNLVCGSL